MRKVAAVLACRVNSRRLYGKPLQLIDVKNNLSILEYLIGSLMEQRRIDAIVLAISEGAENDPFRIMALRLRLPYVIGPSWDVQQRLIVAAESVNAEVIFRVTTESPFIYLDTLEETLALHEERGADLTVIEQLPEGSYYEVFGLSQLKTAHELGEHRHRSELCTLFMMEHPERFLIQRLSPPCAQLCRPDIRLTVDYPDDLVVVRQIHAALRTSDRYIPVSEIIDYLDKHPRLKEVNGWIEAGVGRIWK